jgi:hypothetical protein
LPDQEEEEMSRKSGIQRDDFREVKPTPEEIADWFKTHVPAHRPPYRAEHIPCGKRMWYSGLGIGSHLRACTHVAPCRRCGSPHPTAADRSACPWTDQPEPTGPKVGVVMSSQLGDDWRPSTHLGGAG